MGKKVDYGGAFDIDPQEYWTRDDLNELVQAIEEKEPEFSIREIYLAENDTFDVEFLDKNGNEYQLQEQIRIDRRKADTPQKLCEVYAPILTDAIQKEIDEVEAELRAEQEEDWMKE